MDSEFHILFLSNACLQYFDNTTSSFETILAQNIELKGKWEAAVLEIAYPYAIQNISEPNSYFYISSDKQKITLTIPHGYYESPLSLITKINKLIKKQLKIEEQFFSLTPDGRVKLTPKISNASTLSRKFSYRIEIPLMLANQLGFPERLEKFLFGNDATEISKEISSPLRCNPDLGVPSLLFIYSNIIAPQYTGDAHVPLLRTIPVKRDQNFGTVVTHSVENLVYLPLSTAHLTNIKFDIKTTTGDSYPFVHGVSSLLVHFRRRQ